MFTPLSIYKALAFLSSLHPLPPDANCTAAKGKTSTRCSPLALGSRFSELSLLPPPPSFFFHFCSILAPTSLFFLDFGRSYRRIYPYLSLPHKLSFAVTPPVYLNIPPLPIWTNTIISICLRDSREPRIQTLEGC